LRVETPQSEPHRQGLQLLAAGQIEDADHLLREALNRETREWVRREILADLVRASLWKGDYAGASVRFGLLYSSDPLTRHFGLIPAAWSEKTVDDGQRRAASSLVVESSPVSQLVGASILLVGSDHEELAKDTLKALAGGNDRNIRQLAEAQLWRLNVRDQNVAAYELERWQRHVESLSENMRGGPYYVLGRGYRSKLLRDQAALAMLRLPILYPHDRPLAARASIEAGEILQSQGRTSEAISALREAVVRFPETIAAQEARSILEQRTSESE
jgi:tetratricopeptide (TPR) repeat protein